MNHPLSNPDRATPIDAQLEDTILSFEEIQTELNYKQAQDALRDLVATLDLTPRERAGLEPEIHSLEFMLDKLDRQIVQIAVFGMVGRGKSSLLNALLGQPIFETGAVHGVTVEVQTASWETRRESIPQGLRSNIGLCCQREITFRPVWRSSDPMRLFPI